MASLVIIDCQYDFIEGPLFCVDGKKAVQYLINFMNDRDLDVFYTGDWHSSTNCSFKTNGGNWPIHCVAQSHGASLHSVFYQNVKKKKDQPNKQNFFMKGIDDLVEEYSAFHAKTEGGVELNTVLSPCVYIGGIASEYCVKATILELQKNGYGVTWLLSGTGYINKKEHEKTIIELKEKGINVIE